jgi:hypothetical protein
MAGGASIASAGAFVSGEESLIVGSLQLSHLHYAVLGLGLLCCAWCHYAFLSQKLARDRAVASALRALALDLDDKRPRPAC